MSASAASDETAASASAAAEAASPAPLYSLPAAWSSSAIGESLSLRSSGLSELPSFLLSGSCAHVRALDVSDNPQLCALPAGLGAALPRLSIFFASSCGFRAVPPALAGCASLRTLGLRHCAALAEAAAGALPAQLAWLTMTGCGALRAVPALAGLSGLRKVALAGCGLAAVPPELAAAAAAGNLELLRVSANPGIASLPAWLLRAPALAWLGFADTGAAARGFPGGGGGAAALPELAWQSLALGAQLGEGASGTVHAVDVRGGAAQAALKLFSGGLTSDGWPAAELRALVAAGGAAGGAAACASLIGATAVVTGAPRGAPALLLPLLAPASHARLAAPPSLASCTRDVYADGHCWPLRRALNAAAGVAAALAHLHARGVAHGDVYAHNILVDETGEAALGDLGAAGPTDAVVDGDADARPLLERLDTLAFGRLLAELLRADRLQDGHGPAAARARRLCAACTVGDVVLRPAMAAALDEVRACLALLN